jgi:CBS domain-containing protein
MKCREIMTTNPICCLPDENVGQAARVMRREHVASLPVISDERSRSLIGIVTNRDLVTKVVAESRGPNQTEIADVMTRTIVACRSDDDVDSAIAAMDEYGVRHLPIIDWERSIVGIISHGDLRALPWRRPFDLMREVVQAA